MTYTVTNNIMVKDRVCDCGMDILTGFAPPYNAAVIEKLMAAGAVLTEEEADFTLTSDMTVANADIYLKPTYGRVSRYGLAAFASSMDRIGIAAKTADVCAEVLCVIAGKDERDATTVDIILDKSSGNLKITNIGDMQTHEYTCAVYSIISCAEASSNYARYDGINYGLRSEATTYAERIIDSRNRGFDDDVKRIILFGNYVLGAENYGQYYLKALALRHKIRAEYDELFKNCDVLKVPLTDVWLKSSALAGLPSVSVDNTLFIAGKWREHVVLQAANTFAKAVSS